jgi:hypothetical protein
MVRYLIMPSIVIRTLHPHIITTPQTINANLLQTGESYMRNRFE